MKNAVWAAALTLSVAAAAPSLAQDATDEAPPFSIMSAINGVWGYDPNAGSEVGEFTCAGIALALAVSDDGRVLGAQTTGAEGAPRLAVIINSQDENPLGPAMSITWVDEIQTEPEMTAEAYVLFMEDINSLQFVEASEYERMVLAGGGDMRTSPRMGRCASTN